MGRVSTRDQHLEAGITVAVSDTERRLIVHKERGIQSSTLQAQPLDPSRVDAIDEGSRRATDRDDRCEVVHHASDVHRGGHVAVEDELSNSTMEQRCPFSGTPSLPMLRVAAQHRPAPTSCLMQPLVVLHRLARLDAVVLEDRHDAQAGCSQSLREREPSEIPVGEEGRRGSQKLRRLRCGHAARSGGRRWGRRIRPSSRRCRCPP